MNILGRARLCACTPWSGVYVHGMKTIPKSSYPTIGFVVGFVLGLIFFREPDSAWWQTVGVSALLGVAIAFVGYFLARGDSTHDG